MFAIGSQAKAAPQRCWPRPQTPPSSASPDNPSAEVYGAKHRPILLTPADGKLFIAMAINDNIAAGVDALFYVHVRTARTVYGSVFKRADAHNIVAAWNCSEQVIPMADVVSVAFERRN